MHFEGTVTLDAAIAKVWRVLNDINQFAACMPGVDEVRPVDERTFEGTLAANVGPVSGKFAFTARIVDSEPPPPFEILRGVYPELAERAQHDRGEAQQDRAARMTAVVEGTDSVTKSTVVSEVRLTLEETGPQETALAYNTTVDVKGRLAILGDMVLRATAAVMLEEFTKRLREKVEWPSRASGND